MKRSDMKKVAIAVVVLSAVTGCSTNGHRTDSYDYDAGRYGHRADSGTGGSGFLEFAKGFAEVAGTILSIGGTIWGMQQYEKMNDWGMEQYEEMNDVFDKQYTANMESYGRGF